MVTRGREPVPEDIPAVENLIDQQRPKRTLPLIFVVLGLAGILITAAWIALLGYAAWYLLDWAVG